MLYVSRAPSFISTQFFVLNLHGWFGVLSYKLIVFWYSIIILLINRWSSIIFCLPSGDIYLSLGVFLPCSFVTVSELFRCEDFEVFVILSAVLLPIKSSAASAFFWIALFEAVLSASVADCLAWSRSFWLYLPLKFFLIFLPIFLPYV